jgi:hypothetical protein
MGRLRGTVVGQDTAGGGKGGGERPLEARVHALASTGQFRAPPDAVLKVGGGPPFFYADGAFELDLPPGPADIVLERGTEFRPLRQVVEIPRRGELEVTFRLQRWIDLPAGGWHAGNTHIHYDQHEQRPDERLRLDPRVEDLSVAVISVLQRRELAYASNRYRVGFARHLSHQSLAIDVGEETRHNRTPWGTGYGHVMLLGLQEVVPPLSRGILVDDDDPDYPPLVDACDAAHAQGGLAIWCHNGNGMEAPVAAALGKLDAFNLFDPYWMDPEWDVWYALLNCGFTLPASTGSDWFVCSSNRVYVHTGHAEGDFSYPAWLSGLRAGRTFITNGPALWLDVSGHPPGAALEVTAPGDLPVEVRWESELPLDRVEVVHNGSVVAREAWAGGRRAGGPSGRGDEPAGRAGGGGRGVKPARWAGTLRARVPVSPADGHGWLAARCFGEARNSFGHFLWAHTSPVYLPARSLSARPLPPGPAARAAGAHFLQDLDASLHWIRTAGRFRAPEDRERVVDLFRQAREVYAPLAAITS